MIVVLQTKYEPHKKKRPTIELVFEDEEEMFNRLRHQTSDILDDYNIVITNGFSCKNCGLQIDYELYQYNRLCNRCDDDINH